MGKQPMKGGGNLKAPQYQEESSGPSTSPYGHQQRKHQRGHNGQQKFGGNGRVTQANAAKSFNNNNSGQSQEKPRALTKPCSNQNCGGDHSKLRCAKLSPTERFDVARKCKLCLMCLEVGHIARNCSSTYRCKHCSGPHNWLFCRTVQPYNQQRNNGGNQQSPNVQLQTKPSTSQAYQVATEMEHPAQKDSLSSEEDFEGGMSLMVDDIEEQVYNVEEWTSQQATSHYEEPFDELYYNYEHDYDGGNYYDEPLYEEEDGEADYELISSLDNHFWEGFPEGEREATTPVPFNEEEFLKYWNEMWEASDRRALQDKEQLRAELDAEEEILPDIERLFEENPVKPDNVDAAMKHLTQIIDVTNRIVASRAERIRVQQFQLRRQIMNNVLEGNRLEGNQEEFAEWMKAYNSLDRELTDENPDSDECRVHLRGIKEWLEKQIKIQEQRESEQGRYEGNEEDDIPGTTRYDDDVDDPPPLVEIEHEEYHNAVRVDPPEAEEYDFCSDDSEFNFCKLEEDQPFCFAVQDTDATDPKVSVFDDSETEEDGDEWYDASGDIYSAVPLSDDDIPEWDWDVESDEDTSFNVETPTVEKKGLTFVPLTFTLGTRRMTGMLDTGANINLFPLELAKQMELPMYNVERSLNTPQGKFTVRSAMKVAITVGLITQLVEFLLYSAKPVILLGAMNLKKFRLSIGSDLRASQGIGKGVQRRLRIDRKLTCYSASTAGPKEDKAKPDLLEKLLRLFKSVFSEGGGKVGLIRTEKCVINLTDKMPINQRPYRVTARDQEIIDAKIKELLAAGIIRVSTSPYSFPVVLVAKKDEGEKSRFCVNFIKLNQVTISELFPMPRIEDIKDFFLGARWFTTVDISNGFYHIEVAEEDRAKTAFSTMTGHWEWNRMPFGLKNAPVLFQRVIANLLRKYGMAKFAISYIDDIVVFSKTYEEHLEHLESLFKMVETENIKLKLSKCQFAQSSVVYLGFQIERDSFKPLNSNTMALEKVAHPENVKSLRSFIGKVGFYQRFVPNRAQLLYPLYQLLKKGAEWIWDEEAQRAFEQVKNILTTEPILHLFNPEDDTFLYTDASRKGFGAVLKQSKKGDPKGERFPIGYYSKTLLEHQKNYSVTELELLAIVMAVEFWHFYLLGHVFTIITDHQPLKAIQKFSKVGSRLFSWGMQLRQYDFRIEYIPGETNVEADFLSRHPINLLMEATQTHSFWVEEARIKNAQQEYDLTKLPKRVRNTGNLQEKRLVYVKGDISKSYLPPKLASEVLQELHREKGHIGCRQMELHFTRKYHTQGLAEMLKELILGCDFCARVKKTGRRYGTLGQVYEAEKPFDVIHIDTKSGFRGYGSVKEHLHLAIDGATRFVWSVESKTKIANDFINLINKIIAVQKPKMIVADNYASIKGRAFRAFLKERDIEIVFVAVNHQSANGLVERVNQTMVERMKCGKLEKPQWAWVTIARKCVEDYNKTIHTVTLYPPVYLLTGQDDDGLFKDETLEQSRQLAIKNSQQHHEKKAKAFDAGRKDPNFEEGDQVYVQAKHSLNRKALEPSFEGPFEVKGRIGQTTFEIEKNGKLERRHVSQLKPVALPTTSPRANQKFIHQN